MLASSELLISGCSSALSKIYLNAKDCNIVNPQKNGSTLKYSLKFFAHIIPHIATYNPHPSRAVKPYWRNLLSKRF